QLVGHHHKPISEPVDQLVDQLRQFRMEQPPVVLVHRKGFATSGTHQREVIVEGGDFGRGRGAAPVVADNHLASVVLAPHALLHLIGTCQHDVYNHRNGYSEWTSTDHTFWFDRGLATGNGVLCRHIINDLHFVGEARPGEKFS